jgi:hypothetical protein
LIRKIKKGFRNKFANVVLLFTEIFQMSTVSNSTVKEKNKTSRNKKNVTLFWQLDVDLTSTVRPAFGEMHQS